MKTKKKIPGKKTHSEQSTHVLLWVYFRLSINFVSIFMYRSHCVGVGMWWTDNEQKWDKFEVIFEGRRIFACKSSIECIEHVPTTMISLFRHFLFDLMVCLMWMENTLYALTTVYYFVAVASENHTNFASRVSWFFPSIFVLFHFVVVYFVSMVFR